MLRSLRSTGFLLLFIVVGSRAYGGLPKDISGNASVRIFYPGLNSVHPVQMFSDSTDSAAAGSVHAVNYNRLALIGGGLFGSMAFIHFYQQSGWWRDNRAPFHFQEDLVYGLNVDKIGHFYGAYTLEFVIGNCLEWSDVSEEKALWWGSAGGLLFQTYVEVEDGFSAWGFDRVDFASDVGGAAWPIARYYAPFLRNFDLKFSYHPSPLLGSKEGIGFKGQKHIIIDDYEGQTFWMDLKVHNLLPAEVTSYWPDFLCVAVGYAARNVAGPNPYRVYFIGLDLDMTKIIPPKTAFLKKLGEALNFIHVPLPAIRIVPNTAFYGFYF
jgi:hypothetical protein